MVFGQAFRSERPSGGGLESEASAVLLLVGEAGRSLKRAPFLLGQAFRLEIWIALPACRLGFWADLGVAHHLQRCLLGQAFVGKPVHEGPRVYEPDRSPQAIRVESSRDFCLDGGCARAHPRV